MTSNSKNFNNRTLYYVLKNIGKNGEIIQANMIHFYASLNTIIKKKQPSIYKNTYANIPLKNSNNHFISSYFII